MSIKPVFQSTKPQKINLRLFHSVAICGFRRNGRALYEQLREKNIIIPYILERNYEVLRVLETDINTPIIGFDEDPIFYSHAEVMVIADEYPDGVVKECIEIKGISVPVIGVDGYEF